MTLQINTFDDLLEIVNTHPEWRRKLVKALFPEIDLPKALQELVESNRLMRTQLGNIDARLGRIEDWQGHTDTRLAHMEEWQGRADERFKRIDERFDGMDKRFDGMDARFDGMDARFERMEVRQNYMERDLADLKGYNYESNFKSKADAIFGLLLRRGHDVRQEILSQLESAGDAGQITESDYEQVLVADLLWNGRSKATSDNLFLVIEISWFAEQSDIDRAINRAAVLRKLGLQAIPVVAAKVWSEPLVAEALTHHTVIVDEFKVNKDSWQAALALLTA